MSPQALLALQRNAGNAAVVQMLRRGGPQAQPQSPALHQHGAGCGHQAAVQPTVQRSRVHDVLRAGGRPLDRAVRTEMEARLGADFSDVRLHTDSAARSSAAEVGARAYTSGNHVVIGDGGADKHTLAHELTHVIQQRQGPVAGTDTGSGLKVSDPSDRFEREAEANATRVMSGPAPRENRSEPAAEAAPALLQRSAPSIQRTRLASGKIAFTNVSVKYPESQQKAMRVLGLLSSHPGITQFLDGRTCEITLEKRTTETPADVIDKGPDGVFVTLAAYYFENYDIGYIAGMLCHEFGIHPLAEQKLGPGEEDGFKGMPFPVPGLEGEDRGGPDGFVSMNSETAKQGDHVLGAIPGSPRYTIYLDVALQMADLLFREAEQQEPGAQKKDVTDLIDCFLMDVASIAATNDDRKRGVPRPGNSEGEAVRRDIATVYNSYKGRISRDLSVERQEKIAPLFPADKTPQGVKDDFTTLITRVGKGVLWAWSINNS
nr:DUF4157 domain-containing protein [Kitasatospora acidiphila]